MLNAAAAAFYYLRVVVYMYMREPAEDAAPLSPGLLFRVGLAVTAVATLVFGLFPAILTAVSSAADVLKG
jgi:NADH-quinone oxidoreductase subunit N